MKKFIYIIPIIIFGISFLLFGCNTTSPNIIIDVSSTMIEGETLIATANYEVIWSTSTPDLLSISEIGEIKALKSGNATITATLKSNQSITKNASISITNAIALENIKINIPNRLPVNSKINLKASFTPNNASFKELIWSTNNDEYGYINEANQLEIKNAGSFILTATSTNNPEITNSIEITTYIPYDQIIIDGKTLIDLEETATYTVLAEPSTATGTILWSVSDEEIATINDSGLLTPIKEGIITITATSHDNPDTFGEISVEIKYFERTMNIISDVDTIEVGETISITSEMLPHHATVQTVWISSDKNIATVVTKNSITGLAYLTGVSEGQVTITANAMVNGSITGSKTFYVITPDTTAPIFQNTVDLNLTISAGATFNPLDGITAIDDRDGDITQNIKVEGTVNPLVRSTYNINLSVSDKHGNTANITRTIDVIWDHDLTFIGHAGCYYGVMNSELAFTNAATKQGYTAIECDIRITKDGVFVTCHDETFADKTISQTNWADLKDLTVTKTRGGTTYTTTLCTLERFLDICNEYNMTPVIELKYNPGINNNDCSKMPVLMNLLKDKNLDKKAIFLASQIECLKWVRNNGYQDIELQYLVSSCASSETLNTCVQYNLDISFNIANADNTEEWIKKYQDNDLKVSCYTFSQYQTKIDLIKYVKMGVDYVTCDVLTIKDCYITLQGMKNE